MSLSVFSLFFFSLLVCMYVCLCDVCNFRETATSHSIIFGDTEEESNTFFFFFLFFFSYLLNLISLGLIRYSIITVRSRPIHFLGHCVCPHVPFGGQVLCSLSPPLPLSFSPINFLQH